MSDEEEEIVRVFCTDRGRHQRVSLGSWNGLYVIPPGDYSAEWPTTYGQRADTPMKLATTAGARKMKDRLPAVEIDHVGVTQWRCPHKRCHRNPQLTPENALRLWVSLLETEITELDISHLPF